MEGGWFDQEAVEQERFDADLLQARYEDESREYRRLRDAGWCLHGSGVGRGDGQGPLEGGAYYPEAVGLVGDQQRCTDGCGQVFESFDAMTDAGPVRIPR